MNFHRRIGEERLAHRFAGCERRRAENDKAARVPEIRRHFERNMTAEAPPDEVGLVDRQRVQNGANRFCTGINEHHYVTRRFQAVLAGLLS